MFDVGRVGRDEPRGVDDGVRDDHRPFHRGGEVRDALARLLARDYLGVDAVLATGRELRVEVVGVVRRELEEEPAGVADAVSGDFAEDAVLRDALAGTDLGGLGVPGAAVEEAV